MHSYEQALESILAQIEPLPARRIGLASALGYVLAEEIVSAIDLPPFDNSAMDGYAVRAADTESAIAERPVTLPVIEEIAAGRAPTRALTAGAAARIYTGGAVPDGADAIVPIEDTVPTDRADMVVITAPATPGQYVRRAGGDLRSGTCVLEPGTPIRPYEVALAAAVGRSSLKVVSRPKMAIITTGNELVRPGARRLTPGQIYNSNGYALRAQALASGAIVTRTLDSIDTVASMRTALGESISSDADMIVTSGGVSVGDYDVVKPAVEEGGAGVIEFWRVAIRPGKPFVYGRYNGRHLFGLPGNPVSTMVTFELFVRPALRRLAGCARDRCTRPIVEATVLGGARHEPGRRSFLRARTEVRSGALVSSVLTGQGSHMISAMARANSLLIVPEDADGIAAGGRASVMMLDDS